jgi:hypothetical protein
VFAVRAERPAGQAFFLLQAVYCAIYKTADTNTKNEYEKTR